MLESINWLDSLGLTDAGKFLSYLMIAAAFFVGIMLLVSAEAFELFDKELRKEYGMKKRLFPQIEDRKYEFVDYILLKCRFISGLIITIISFIFLLIYK